MDPQNILLLQTFEWAFDIDWTSPQNILLLQTFKSEHLILIEQAHKTFFYFRALRVSIWFWLNGHKTFLKKSSVNSKCWFNISKNSFKHSKSEHFTLIFTNVNSSKLSVDFDLFVHKTFLQFKAVKVNSWCWFYVHKMF